MKVFRIAWLVLLLGGNSTLAQQQQAPPPVQQQTPPAPVQPAPATQAPPDDGKVRIYVTDICLRVIRYVSLTEWLPVTDSLIG
jgi:hypothetical protein